MATDGNGTRYSDLCRLCATRTNTDEDFNIFENEGSTREIYKKIETCLSIQVHESDELPKMICQYCFYKLEVCCEFRERAVRTESVLISLFKELIASRTCNEATHLNIGSDHNDVIMIQHHDLLNDEIDLSHLHNTEDGIILTNHQNVDPLDMDLNHELTQPDSILAPTDVTYTEDNLQLTQQEHHLLAEQFSLQLKNENQVKNEELVKLEPKNEGENCLVIDASPSGVEWLRCNMCGQNFESQVEFQLHYDTHFHKCDLCMAVFTNAETLSVHKKETHPPDDVVVEAKTVTTRLKRATLPLKGENKDGESDGESLHLGEGAEDDEEEEDDAEVFDYVELNQKKKKCTPKECKTCGKTYKTNYKLAEHMRKHTGEKPYKCGSCEKAFRSKIGLAQHEAKHTGQYDLSCPTCGKGFQCKSYLMVHQRVHSDVKPYPCTTCGRNFKTKQSLLDHTNRHLGVKPYMCDVCGRGFITKGLCKAHQKVHTGLDNRKYSCKVCNKMFVSKSYLQTHLRIHTGEKPFMCEVCGKGFLTRVDLRIHSTMHTGEKSYVCEMCGKAFARRDALRCHRRSHTGERPYSCDQCGQTFTQFSPMAIHRRLHTGERPYTCEVCGKAFVSRSTMTSHLKKHDNR